MYTSTYTLCICLYVKKKTAGVSSGKQGGKQWESTKNENTQRKERKERKGKKGQRVTIYPYMNAVMDVSRRGRKNPGTADVVVVVLYARAGMGDRGWGVEGGAWGGRGGGGGGMGGGGKAIKQGRKESALALGIEAFR